MATVTWMVRSCTPSVCVGGGANNVELINFTTYRNSMSKISHGICLWAGMLVLVLFCFLRQNGEVGMHTESTHCWLTGICLESIISENPQHSGTWGPQMARGLSGLHGQRKWANCILHSHITSRQNLTIISTAVRSFGVEEGLMEVPGARVQARLG